MNQIIRDVRHSLLELVRLTLSVVITVKKTKVMFQSTPDYSDNSRAFSDYLLENTDLAIYWSVKDAHKYHNTDRITFIEKNGGNGLLGKLKFIYHTVSSQYLFSTHSAFLYANRYRQKYICLWHGTPLKKIAVLQNPASKHYLSNTVGILCSSKYYVPIMAKCFGWEEKRIIPIGIPRNDWLFQETGTLEKLGINLGNNEKIIIYLPTFRKTTAGGVNDSDAEVFKIGIFDFKNEDNLNRLNMYMKEQNLHLIVKPHPLDINLLGYCHLSNVTIIPPQKLSEYDVQLNQLLHCTNALLTDYSGVYTDYLNLDKPIGFLLTDYEEYYANRGFLYDNPLDFMPGMKIYNEQDIKKFCEEVSKGIDKYKSERERLRYVYNDYQDGKNCERLAEFLHIKL